MKKGDFLKKGVSSSKRVKKEFKEEFVNQRRILYFGIALVGFLLAIFPLFSMKIIGVILIIFAILLYFSDKSFV